MTAFDAEKSSFSAPGGPVGVLMLHGYTGSPASLRPWAEAFADAGYTVEAPLLPGHGGAIEDLMWTTFAEWRAAAEAALVELSSRADEVVVCGHSMGGTLALALALGPVDIAGLVLVNPFVEPPAPEFVAMLERALEAGVELIPSIRADVAKEGVESDGEGATPIRPMLSLFDAARSQFARLAEIQTNVLLFSSRVDHVVSPVSSDLLEGALSGHVERVVLEKSYHVATLDYDAGEIEARSIEFVEKIGR